MGYFSSLAIEEYRVEREPGYPSRKETLQFFLEDLYAKLDELDENRPHDPMDPYYDYYFYSRCIIHYYENPRTVQDVLYGIKEVKALLEKLSEEEEPVIEPIEQLPGQVTLAAFIDDFIMPANAA